jgi:hypothetical protein
MKKGDIPAGKPNLYTNPGKKGTYGFIKTTLSERKGAGGVMGEYTYQVLPLFNDPVKLCPKMMIIYH